MVHILKYDGKTNELLADRYIEKNIAFTTRLVERIYNMVEYDYSKSDRIIMKAWKHSIILSSTPDYIFHLMKDSV